MGLDAHTALILTIVTIAITAGGIYVIHQVHDGLLAVPAQQYAGMDTDRQQSHDLSFVNVVGRDPSGRNITAVRFEVRYTGDGALPLNDTLITITTPGGTADLRYRNGTLTQDPVNGYYTQ